MTVIYDSDNMKLWQYEMTVVYVEPCLHFGISKKEFTVVESIAYVFF